MTAKKVSCGADFRGSCKIVQDRSLAHQRASRGRGSVSAALSVSAFRAARASKRLHRILQLPLKSRARSALAICVGHASACQPALAGFFRCSVEFLASSQHDP
jgi:hypothetical protein